MIKVETKCKVQKKRLKLQDQFEHTIPMHILYHLFMYMKICTPSMVKGIRGR